MDQSTQAALADLVNKADITSVVNSYFRSLDEKNFDAQHFATFLTTDARMTRPNGASLVGPEEISASHRQSFARFEGTQHFLTTPDISLEGDSAAVRANLIAMHMWQGSHTNANNIDNFFVAGGVVSARLIRTDGLWKISQLSHAVAWRGGSFKNMMETR
jgi:ketosteroid isomerase-like protein